MLQPGQLRGQGLVGLHQLRQLPGHPRDLPIPRHDLLGLLGQLSGLAVNDGEQLLARHLLQPGHRKIQSQAGRSTAQRHTSNIADRSVPMINLRLNVYLVEARVGLADLGVPVLDQ